MHWFCDDNHHWIGVHHSFSVQEKGKKKKEKRLCGWEIWGEGVFILASFFSETEKLLIHNMIVFPEALDLIKIRENPRGLSVEMTPLGSLVTVTFDDSRLATLLYKDIKTEGEWIEVFSDFVVYEGLGNKGPLVLDKIEDGTWAWQRVDKALVPFQECRLGARDKFPEFVTKPVACTFHSSCFTMVDETRGVEVKGGTHIAGVLEPLNVNFSIGAIVEVGVLKDWNLTGTPFLFLVAHLPPEPIELEFYNSGPFLCVRYPTSHGKLILSLPPSTRPMSPSPFLVFEKK